MGSYGASRVREGSEVKLLVLSARTSTYRNRRLAFPSTLLTELQINVQYAYQTMFDSIVSFECGFFYTYQ